MAIQILKAEIKMLKQKSAELSSSFRAYRKLIDLLEIPDIALFNEILEFISSVDSTSVSQLDIEWFVARVSLFKCLKSQLVKTHSK